MKMWDKIKSINLTKNNVFLIILIILDVIALYKINNINYDENKIKKVIIDIDTSYSPSKRIIDNYRDSFYRVNVDSAIRIITR